MNSENPQNIETLEIDGNAFTFETPTEITDDIFSFYFDNWHKEHETVFQRAFRKTPYDILEHHKDKIIILRDASGKVAAMSLPDNVIFDDEKENLGTFVVAEEYKNKGLATHLAKKRINLLMNQEPDRKNIDVFAETKEGLHFSLSFAEKIKNLVKLDIDCSENTLREIIYNIFEKFKDEVKKEGFFGMIEDLRREGKLKINISQNKEKKIIEKWEEILSSEMYPDDINSLDDMLIEDALLFIFLDNGLESNIDLYKTEDKEELREKLKKIGIVVK
ncbi:hypothetical protein K9L27_03260 [Candidatus Gracilibacteria bacterium]|nr:hypothetical protein [Candidatus Gracilibacteria bacterium]